MTPDDQFLAELQSTSNRVHKATVDADRPPSNQWVGILATVTSPNSQGEESQMNTFPAQPAALASPSPASEHRSPSRLINIAMSVAVIAALILGGWFANVHWNSPSEPTPEPRLAVITTPGTSPSIAASPAAESATCDVEPLSVDRVMEIVENPAYFTANGPTEPRAESPMQGSPPEATLWEVQTSLELIAGTSNPDQEQFDSATSVAKEYVNCMIFGTQGQVWSFYSPVFLQSSILAEFPVYSSKEEVRAKVKERIDKPAYTGEAAWNFLPFISDVETVTVNPDRELAILQRSESSYFDQVMMVGVSFVDADGQQIALTTGTGRDLVPNDPMFTGKNDVMLQVVIAKSRFSDTWLVIPWPSQVQIGWPSATP